MRTGIDGGVMAMPRKLGAMCVLLGVCSPALAATDVWFMVGSDAHYTADAANNAAEHANVVRMNAIAGKTFYTGQAIGTPRGVMMLGDLADNPTQSYWDAWVADFGLNGTGGTLQYPVYEGWGNHDVQGIAHYYNSPILKKQSAGATPGIYERNQTRTFTNNGVTQNVYLSPQGYVYSWDWGPVHFIQAGYAPCDGIDPNRPQMGGDNYNPTGSLPFIEADLAEHVGTSGRPVVIVHHYDVNNTFGWTQAEIEAYYDSIKGYNIAAVMYGHTGTAVTTWNGHSSIHTVNTGSLGVGFWVGHFNDNSLSIAYTTGESGGNPVWSSTYSGSWAVSIPADVPEPATGLLVLGGAMLVMRRAGRGRRAC